HWHRRKRRPEPSQRGSDRLLPQGETAAAQPGNFGRKRAGGEEVHQRTKARERGEPVFWRCTAEAASIRSRHEPLRVGPAPPTHRGRTPCSCWSCGRAARWCFPETIKCG